MSISKITRRDALKGALAAVASLPLSTSMVSRAHAAHPNMRYLFIICASGGADIRDSFLPLSSSLAASGIRSQLPEEIRTVGAHQCVERVAPKRFYVGAGTQTGQNGPVQRQFLERHGDDLAVMATTGTSVNHIVAARRWLTGAGMVMDGRTLLESHAMHYATPDMPLAAVNMANGGYVGDGDDPLVPAHARAETVANALLLGVATHPSRGVQVASRGARQAALLARARAVRDQMDNASPFVQRHANSRLLHTFRRHRATAVPLMEELDLITQLAVAGSGSIPLPQYGLSPSPHLGLLSSVGFTDLQNDPFLAQAALAYLLVKSGASCAVALGAPAAPIAGPGYPGYSFTLKHTPIAYDFSHTDHEATQLAMWDRTLRMADGLIRLLKATPVDGGTMWDQSLVYMPTEFGRTAGRPSGTGQFGTGHELNNGVTVVSPLLNAGVYGSVDPATGLTTGWNGTTGAASMAPEDVKGEADVVATIGAALGLPLTARDQEYVRSAVVTTG